MIKRVKNKDVPVNRLRLQASERNEDWSTDIFKQFLGSLTQSDIKFYPNLEELYSKLKKHYGVTSLQIGTGSDKCIETFLQSHMNTHKKLTIFSPAFPMYSIYGKLYGYEVVEVRYENLNTPYDEFLSSIDKDSVVIITNPTSPIGQGLHQSFIRDVLAKNVPTLVDEAYIEFSELETSLDLIDKHNNLFVTRTFSKALGSAGIRLGIIAYNEKNEDLIGQYRPMYEINALTSKWALTLLDNFKEVYDYYNKVKEVRNEVAVRCLEKGIPVVPGLSNWIHIQYENLPEEIIFKRDVSIPGSNEKWVRLQITSNIEDYKWLT